MTCARCGAKLDASKTGWIKCPRCKLAKFIPAKKGKKVKEVEAEE